MASGGVASGGVASGGVASGDGASVGGTSGASVSGVVIFFTSPRIVKRRHLTSLQASSLGLLGTPFSMYRIRWQALSFVTSRIIF